LAYWCKTCTRHYQRSRNHTRKEYMREWFQNHPGYYTKRYQADPESGREKMRIFRANHPPTEEQRQRKKAYDQERYRQNPEPAKRQLSEWAKNHPEYKVITQAKRRARKREAPGSFTLDDVRNKYNEQGGMCMYCQEPVGDLYHVDHYIPLVLGGSNYPDNIVISCPTCNCRKGGKHPDAFMEILRQDGGE
jgi:5-methylcytosine-specific restriction endonuclease McrA